MLNKNSFAETIDNLNEAFFFNKKITEKDKIESAKWIAGRQGLPGAYRGMFAPTKADHENGIRVFTGEQITSNAAIRHILSEEASRVLLTMKVRNADVNKAYELSKQSLLNALLEGYPPGKEAGFYCCGKCSAALWRHFTAGGFDNAEVRLTNGLKFLKMMRTGNGKWKRFPFYYTILTLNDINLPEAIDELRYTAPLCERLLKYQNRDNKYSFRRKVLLERALDKISN